MQAAVEAAQQQVDQELKATVDPQTYGAIAEMLDLQTGDNQLAHVEADLAPDFAFEDQPLSGSQLLALANVLKATYELPPNSNLIAFRTAGIDSAGLSDQDRKAINLAGDILSEPQLTLFREELDAETKRIVEIANRKGRLARPQ